MAMFSDCKLCVNIADFLMGTINANASVCSLAGRGVGQAEQGAEEQILSRGCAVTVVERMMCYFIMQETDLGTKRKK